MSTVAHSQYEVSSQRRDIVGHGEILPPCVSVRQLCSVQRSSEEVLHNARRRVTDFDSNLALSRVVDVEIAEKKEAIAKTDKAFTGSRESLRSTFADLIQDAV